MRPYPLRVDKRDRHRAILELVAQQVVESQEELRLLLKRRGWDVTQSTFLCVLCVLWLVCFFFVVGVCFLLSERSLAAEDPTVALDEILPRFFSSLDGVGELLVL